MLFLVFIIVIFLYAFCDVNYFIRTAFIMWVGRLFQRQYSLDETTSVYGVCTTQDVDITFRHMRLARVLRELDFARFHFWDRTGVYKRSLQLGFGALQAATTAVELRPVPLFVPFRIDTNLICWDEKSFFMYHQLVTLHDGCARVILTSRQHVIGADVRTALKGLSTPELKNFPEDLELWIKSMEISSSNLRRK